MECCGPSMPLWPTHEEHGITLCRLQQEQGTGRQSLRACRRSLMSVRR